MIPEQLRLFFRREDKSSNVLEVTVQLMAQQRFRSRVELDDAFAELREGRVDAVKRRYGDVVNAWEVSVVADMSSLFAKAWSNEILADGTSLEG